MALRIIFMGTPDFAVPTLRALVGAGHEIVCVYTQPPRAAGRRGLGEVKTPVHQAAELLGYEVRTPENFKTEDACAEFLLLEADVAVVVAYGLLLPVTILEGTKLGAYNGHASLLPRWRGAAPIQRAIMAGDSETGMNIMRMDKGLDTGPVALTARVPISQNMTAGDLHNVLMLRGAKLMTDAMERLEVDQLPLVVQVEEGATYAKKIDKAETRIDFKQDALSVHNHIRGLAPFPGAWMEIPDGQRCNRVKVLGCAMGVGEGSIGSVVDGEGLTIACGQGAVRLTKLQKAGGKVLAADDFLRGNALQAGTVIA